METHDFIEKYVKLLSGITDALEEFQEAAALFLLSTAVGRKWVFRSIPETPIFIESSKDAGKLLNLWFIILGKSRISRKTSGVISHVEEVLKRIFGEQRSLTRSFTPEFLIKEMSKKSEYTIAGSETLCYWISDEVAWFFKQLKKKDSYMTDADDILSTIYDGRTLDRGTIGRDKEIVRNPYLTCLIGSTNYLPTLLDELQIRQGFLNRFIYVTGKRKQRKPLRTEPLNQEEKKEVDAIEDFLKALASRTSVTVIEMTNEARQTYDSFEEEIEERIANEDLDIKEGYCGQLPNLAVRLSCLYKISRMTPAEIRNYSNVLTVEKQDVDRAIEYSWKVWAWFEEVIEIMLKPQAKSTSEGNQTSLGRRLVLQKLKEGPSNRAALLEVMSKAGIGHSTLDNIILPSLINDNLIKRDSVRFGWYSPVTGISGNSKENK